MPLTWAGWYNKDNIIFPVKSLYNKAMSRPVTPELKRFLAKVGPRPKEKTTCWLWNASIGNRGYGWFGKQGGGQENAHRASYRLFVGPAPKGKHVLHKCDVKRCVNPLHLRIGTNLDNMHDRDKKGRGKTPGHPDHPQTKLSYAKAAEIRRRRKAGESATALAAEFKVHYSTIYDVLRGEMWSVTSKLSKRMKKAK